MAGSLIRLASLNWQAPHNIIVPWRQNDLTVKIPYRVRGEPLHLVIDSIGLKVLGQAEWKVRKQMVDRRRVWRNVHLDKVSAAHQANLIVPPPHNGKPWQARTAGANERDESLCTITRLGRRLWKRWSGYHHRIFNETSMTRLKRLSARDPVRQVAKVRICSALVNTFNAFGMPDTVAAA